MINVNDVVTIGNDFSLTALDKDFFFLPNSFNGIIEEKLYSLNSTAYFVASCIDGKMTAGDIANRLAVKTHSNPEVVEKDVLELLNKFEEKRLIKSREN